MKRIGRHLYRNRGKYAAVALTACAIALAVLFRRQRFWHRMARENSREWQQLWNFVCDRDLDVAFEKHLDPEFTPEKELHW